MSIKLDGLSGLQKGFNDALKKTGTANSRAFTDDVLDLLSNAVENAPVDKGDLRGSGSATINGATVAKGTKEGSISVCGTAPESDVLTATIGFEEPYAIAQHEHTEYKHPKGGQAKYLEQPFRQRLNKYIQHIADANSNALK